MRTNKMVMAVISIIALGVAVAWSQEFPRLEGVVDYSFARYAPSGSYTKGHTLNGGGGSIQYNINDVWGLKMDLQGYGSNHTEFTIPPNVNFPGGATGSVQGNLFTYMFGPEIKFRPHGFHPFGHLLLGGAHSNVYGNAFKQICQPVAGTCSFSARPTGNAFAMSFGGGVDIALSHFIAFRPAEFDYLLTDFSNRFTNGHQNNFQY